jgi:hypothetical protein
VVVRSYRTIGSNFVGLIDEVKIWQLEGSQTVYIDEQHGACSNFENIVLFCDFNFEPLDGSRCGTLAGDAQLSGQVLSKEDSEKFQYGMYVWTHRINGTFPCIWKNGEGTCCVQRNNES